MYPNEIQIASESTMPSENKCILLRYISLDALSEKCILLEYTKEEANEDRFCQG
jgi:hypothetical protein